MTSYSKYLVSASSSGGKFWEVEVVGNEMRTRYGKLGADREWSVKEFDSEEKALKAAEQKANSKIRKGYDETARPKSVSDDAVVLGEVPVRGVFYFRAFDRWPGGNADMFTIKVTLKTAPGDDIILKAQTYHNWDGEHWVYEEDDLAIPNVSDRVPPLMEAAQALIDGDLNKSEFLINDSRYDSDASDTEWRSLEFSLFIEDDSDADEKLVLHLMQKAQDGIKTTREPDEASRTFMDAVHGLTGIGRVAEYSEGKDSFSKAYKPKGESKGYQDGDVPLYL